MGIGGSAGGLEACHQLIDQLPADIGMAFVVVLHLAPARNSALAELLASHASLPAMQVTDGMPLEAGRVHVIPPGMDMVLMDGRLLLHPRQEQRRPGQPPDARGQFLPINTFFSSLASAAGSRAIGVILSGTGSDGAQGLKEIKAAGGITIAQDPGSARSDGMPRSAIATGAVDLVMPPDRIAHELVRIARHPLARATAPDDDGAPDPEHTVASLAGPADENLTRIFQLLRNATGVDFTHYKLPTIRRRLHRRMVLHKIHRLADYARFLQQNRGEILGLYQDILINVTRFFREPESFEMLSGKVFPRILAERQPDQPVRIWVPGCSTGEECFSIAIELREFLGEAADTIPVQIFATDIADTVIEHARSGSYPETIAADVPAERLRKYFSKAGGSYRIAKQVRDMCVFARQDLTRDPPFSRLDLIVCRNVLIYLGPMLQKRLMTVFHYALRPTGFLMLGSAESVGPFADLFAVADKKHRLFLKKTGAFAEAAHLPAERQRSAPPLPVAARKAAPDTRATDLSESDRVLLARFAPAGVVIDGDNQVVQFHGQTGPYLQPAPGQASLNLMKLAREGLLYGLQTALHEARTRRAPARKEGLRVRENGHFRAVNIEVVPLPPGGDARRCLVVFQDAAPPSKSAADPPPQRGRGRKPARGRAGRGRGDTRVQALESELAASRDYMQSIIQNLEAANEELQSANEEVLSSNEELQSTNEELDTAKEELQSSNEELNTLNDELQGRNEELSHVNGDLVNLLANVHIAIVMVTSDLRVRRMTPAAEKLLNLIPGDVGRPIGDIRSGIELPDLQALIHQSIKDMTVQERDVRDAQGRWYSLRVRPYKTLEDKIDGAVVALVNVDESRRTERTQAGRRVDAADERARNALAGQHIAEAVIEALDHPLLLLDEDQTVRSVNHAFRTRFGLEEGQGVGLPLTDLVHGQLDGPGLRQLLRQVRENGGARDLRLAYNAGGTRRQLTVNARRVSNPDGNGSFIVMSLRPEEGEPSE